jgi:hypothetical protein
MLVALEPAFEGTYESRIRCGVIRQANGRVGAALYDLAADACSLPPMSSPWVQVSLAHVGTSLRGRPINPRIRLR